MSPDEVGIAYITDEKIVSAKYDSHIPTYAYTITDYHIVEELLNSLENAVFQKCDKPTDIAWLEMLYISTSENEYAIGVENGIFRISINGKSAYYRCSKKQILSKNYVSFKDDKANKEGIPQVIS